MTQQDRDIRRKLKVLEHAKRNAIRPTVCRVRPWGRSLWHAQAGATGLRAAAGHQEGAKNPADLQAKLADAVGDCWIAA